MKRPYRLTPSEVEILQMGADDPSIITDYWFRPAGADKGWRFDENFVPEGAWQRTLHHAAQTDIVCVGGFGCLAYDVLLYDPIAGTETEIGKLAEIGKPVTVLAWDGARFLPVKAKAPFRKGKALMYQVTLADGKTIRAVGTHAFLTPTGYIPLQELSCGQLVGVHANWDLTIRGADARDCPEPLPPGVMFVEIASIRPLAERDYYDLEVPVFGNYVAQGFVNHNTGKTSGVAMSACVWCMSMPWFKFLNVAPKSWQAKQMYDYIILTSAGTPFERLIWEKPRRPYPTILLKFQVGDTIYDSSLEFMSADKDATGILSWEGDWINIEEAGLLDNLDEIVTAVGSRLRGSVRGRPRLGRLSMISNSWDNEYLWYYFDQAVSDPEHYLSMLVSTKHNKNVTEEQLEKMIKRIPENEREQFLDGARPEGRGKYFSKEKIYLCEDQLYSELLVEKTRAGVTGYRIDEIYGAGVVAFMTPPSVGTNYVILGDPGTGAAPSRNAPTIMVWEVPENFPRSPARLVAFWWGNGNGAITPFVEKLLEFRVLYRPLVCAVDSTGTQRNMAEVINIQILGLSGEATEDSPTVGVYGLDFSGTKKAGYLVVARMFVEHHLLTWPKFVIGLRSQLSNYDPDRDKNIAQDIVAVVAMSAYVIRLYFDVDLSALQDPAPAVDATAALRRYAETVRNRRSGARTVRAEQD